jgi:hypothetical protein
VRLVAPARDGFRIAQFNERQVNADVADLKTAVNELQAAVQILIAERNVQKG